MAPLADLCMSDMLRCFCPCLTLCKVMGFRRAHPPKAEGGRAGRQMVPGLRRGPLHSPVPAQAGDDERRGCSPRQPHQYDAVQAVRIQLTDGLLARPQEINFWPARRQPFSAVKKQAKSLFIAAVRGGRRPAEFGQLVPRRIDAVAEGCKVDACFPCLCGIERYRCWSQRLRVWPKPVGYSSAGLAVAGLAVA